MGVVPGGTSRSFVGPFLGPADVSTGVGGGGQGGRAWRPLVLTQRSGAADTSKAQPSQPRPNKARERDHEVSLLGRG